MILCDYACETCGTFESLVSSPAPDSISCECGAIAAWSPTPIMGKVRAVEAVRGSYAKPDRKTWLDTRGLGEGQSLEEFRAKRRKIRDEQRWRELKEMG